MVERFISIKKMIYSIVFCLLIGERTFSQIEILSDPYISLPAEHAISEELDSQAGLSQYLKSAEGFLNNEMTQLEFDKKYAQVLSAGFGLAHFDLTLDIVQKKKNLFSADFQCAWLKINCEKSNQTSLEELPIEPHSYIIWNAKVYKADSIQMQSLPEIYSRFVIISQGGQSLVFVGKPSEFIKWSIQNKNKASSSYKNDFTTLEKINANSDRSSWYENNKRWIWPAAVVLAGTVLYSLKDKNIVIEK